MHIIDCSGKYFTSHLLIYRQQLEDQTPNIPSEAKCSVLSYHGSLEDNEFHGFGKMKLTNGNQYCGHFDVCI